MRYLDTSAVSKLLLGEAHADALITALRDGQPRVASVLLRVELLRAVARRAPDRLALTEAALATVQLVPIDEPVIAAAAALKPAALRSLDAIHLATALSLGEALTEFVTYDRQLAAAAQDAGLTVVAPGIAG